MNKKITYKDAGVDIKKADEAIEMSKKDISSTYSKNVLSSIGGFGSMYSLKDVLSELVYKLFTAPGCAYMTTGFLCKLEYCSQ